MFYGIEVIRMDHINKYLDVLMKEQKAYNKDDERYKIINMSIVAIEQMLSKLPVLEV